MVRLDETAPSSPTVAPSSPAITDSQDVCSASSDLKTTNGCPPNNFSIDKKKLNEKKGIATIEVTVPGAGELTLEGKSLKSQPPVRDWARTGGSPKPVNAAGTFQLKVVPTGRAQKKLKMKGKAKVRLNVTFTPTGGLPNSQQTKVELIRKQTKR
jgi:hypothetical protein